MQWNASPSLRQLTCRWLTTPRTSTRIYGWQDKKNTWNFLWYLALCPNNTFLEINFTKIPECRQCSNQNYMHIMVSNWIYIYCCIISYQKKEDSSQNSSNHLLSHNFHGLAECFWSSVSHSVESFDVSLVLVDLLWKRFIHMAVDSLLLHGNLVVTMRELASLT